MKQWAVAFCTNALFIFKADEKMFINLPSLVDYLLSLKEHLESIYVGSVTHQDNPNRDPPSLEFSLLVSTLPTSVVRPLQCPKTWLRLVCGFE